MRTRWPLGIVIVVSACNSGSDDDRPKIDGRVVDATDDRPIAGARVATSPETETVQTASDGTFEIVRGVRPNRLVRVTARAEGFDVESQDVTPSVGGGTNLVFRLEPRVICVPGSRRCAQGGETDGFQVCNERGNAYDPAIACTDTEVCVPEAPGCSPARRVTVTSEGGLVSSSPSGISCAPTCEASFVDGTFLRLTAQPFPGGSFSGWTGDCSVQGTEPVCDLVVDRDLAVGASFLETLATVEVEFTTEDGASGEVQLDGTRDGEALSETCRDDCAIIFDRGTPVDLAARADPGFEFAGWGDDCEGEGDNENCRLTLDGARRAGVRFTPVRFRLTADVAEGAGTIASTPAGIDCGSDCEADFNEGTTVSLVATPAPSNRFIGWSGACSGSVADACTVTMDRDLAVTARFEGESYDLTVSRTGDGTGTVTSSPSGIDCGGDCSQVYGGGQAVTLTASAAAGNVFTGWGGDCSASGADPSCMLVMDAARSVSAAFDAVALDVTVSVTGAGRVRSTPPGIDCPGSCTAGFVAGTSLTFEAAPDVDQGVSAWTGPCASAGRDTSCTFVVDRAASVDVAFDDFFVLPLRADMSCEALFRFEAAAPRQNSCGGGGNAVEVGSWTAAVSRSSALGDAYRPGAEGDALDTTVLLGDAAPFTFELSVRRTGTAFGGFGSGVLVSDRDAADPGGPGFELLALDDGAVELQTFTSSVTFSSVRTSTDTLAVDRWVHLTVVRRSQDVELFVDGASAASLGSAPNWTASSSTAIVGARRDGSGYRQTLQGDVDEIRFSSVARR